MECKENKENETESRCIPPPATTLTIRTDVAAEVTHGRNHPKGEVAALNTAKSQVTAMMRIKLEASFQNNVRAKGNKFEQEASSSWSSSRVQVGAIRKRLECQASSNFQVKTICKKFEAPTSKRNVKAARKKLKPEGEAVSQDVVARTRSKIEQRQIM